MQEPRRNLVLRNLANIVSILGVLPICILLGEHGYHYLLPLIIYNNVMDDLDGVLAVKLNIRSNFGALLDNVCDAIAHTVVVMVVGIHFAQEAGASNRGLDLPRKQHDGRSGDDRTHCYPDQSNFCYRNGLAYERVDSPHFLRLTGGADLWIRSNAVLDCHMDSACRVDARSLRDALFDSKSDKVSRRDRCRKCDVTCGVATALCGPGRRSGVCCHLSRFIRGRRDSLAMELRCVC